MSPTVSIVMSVYNGSRYLRQAVDSILAQTFEDFEFLIINDGSTDNTKMILASYEDPRIFVLRNGRNLGLADSLNRGIGAAQGAYVARQDADDISHPERLIKQVAFLDTHSNFGVVGTTAQWIDEFGDKILVWQKVQRNAEIQEALLRYCCLVHGSVMYRRQAIQDIGGYDNEMRTGQDYDLWLRMCEFWDMACLPDVLYSYRKHDRMNSLVHARQQSRNARIALENAMMRRKTYYRIIFSPGMDAKKAQLLSVGRRRLAERYVYWSAGAREISRRLALWFLLIALRLDPLCPDAWAYLVGIARRKLERAGDGPAMQ